MISVNLLCNFIEISLWYGCFSVTFIRTPIEGCCFGCNEYFFVRTRRIMIFMEYHLKGNVTIRTIKVILLIKRGSGTFFVIDFKILSRKINTYCHHFNYFELHLWMLFPRSSFSNSLSIFEEFRP